MPNPLLKDLNPSSEELKKIATLLAKERGIKGYERVAENEILSALTASELLKEKIKKIREELKKLRHKFSKSKVNEIRKKLYEIENEKNISAPKETEKYLLELEKIISKLKKVL